jgi:hypothetical protein
MALSARQTAILNHLKDGTSLSIKFLPLSEKETHFLGVLRQGGDFTPFNSDPFFKQIIEAAKEEQKHTKPKKKKTRDSKAKEYYKEKSLKEIEKGKKRQDLLDDIALMALDIDDPDKMLKADLIKAIKKAI